MAKASDASPDPAPADAAGAPSTAAEARAISRLDKQHLLATLRSRLADDLAALVRRQQDTAHAATHAENRSEHSKDTRATEQSYLARGLAQRVEDLQAASERLARLEPTRFAFESEIGLGALVSLYDEESETTERWWLVPAAGGIDLEMAPAGVAAEDPEHARVRTVTPAAPLGRSLVGLTVGDEGRFRTPKGERRFEVVAIA